MLIIAVLTAFAMTNKSGDGILINNGDSKVLDKVVFLPTQHGAMKYQKQPHTLNHALEAKKHNISLWREQLQYGRCFYVNRPLNTEINEKKAFNSILNLSPNTNTNTNSNCIQNTQIIINNNNASNSTSFMNGNSNNMTPNNKEYDIYMNKEYVDILPFIIMQNIKCPLYLNNSMETQLNPDQIGVSKAAKQIMYEDVNAGGCSELSEGFSFEILRQCFNVKLVKTEMSIKYWWNSWKKTDYSIKMNDVIIGVSVTRAMKYSGLFTKDDAMTLLTKKLVGINESSIGVLECDEWQRQILHIWATDEYIEGILHKTFLQLLFRSPELVGNSVILVSVASQDMWWIFYQNKYFKKKQNKRKRKRMKGIKKNILLTAVT